MEDLIQKFLDKRNVFAVVGASRNPEKYGHQVFKDLMKAGYKVYPINPNADEILGVKCYPSLKDLPEKPDVIDLVVPPQITEKVIRECKELGIKMIWMQPGSESEDAIKFCKENGMDVVHGVCVMIERRKL
ncbi:CoA-binding protein [Candidatus Bathyarchaeota archaeon]|nr:MAG: CoA-binding protein [Candidatus Bathyarchaeota archaeon]